MNRTLRFLCLLVCMMGMLSGCATMETMDLARENKKKGGQLAYLLLPGTLVVDAVTFVPQAVLVGEGLKRGP